MLTNLMGNPEFEISLFRAISSNRPLGPSKHFAMMAILRSLKEELGRDIDRNVVWDTLNEFYKLDDMDALYQEGAEDLTSNVSSSSSSVAGPADAFTLDALAQQDAELSDLIHDRRFRGSESPEHQGNTPEPQPAPSETYDTGSPLTEQDDAETDGQEEEEAGDSEGAAEEDSEEAEEQEEEEEEEQKSKSKKRKAPAKSSKRRTSGQSKATNATGQADKKSTKKKAEPSDQPPKKRKR